MATQLENIFTTQTIVLTYDINNYLFPVGPSEKRAVCNKLYIKTV